MILNILTGAIYAIAVFGMTAARPMRSAAVGEHNAILLSTLALMSFIAVLIGCLCCRRRNKKGFEEFRNESGSIEENKTEYPIFRALSPESQSISIMAPAVNNSNENLIVNDIDNNNGPISPADMENIENNNAVDYIQNQNEIAVITEPTFSHNRNILDQTAVNCFHQNGQQAQPNTQIPKAVAVHPTTEFSSSASIQPSIHTEDVTEYFIYGTEKNDINNINIVQNKISRAVSSSDTLEFRATSKEDMLNAVTNIDAVSCSERDESTIIKDDDAGSIRSKSSNRSIESNSIEEALRVLDSAIEAEELNDICDFPDDELDDNTANFENVIRQLLINNGINGILSSAAIKKNSSDQNKTDFSFNYTTSQIHDEAKTNLLYIKIDQIDIESIRAEAEMLVDNVLMESRILAEERREIYKNDCQNCVHILAVSQPSVDCNKNCTLQTENISSPILKSGCNETFLMSQSSAEDSFVENMPTQTSTPFVENKRGLMPVYNHSVKKGTALNFFESKAENSSLLPENALRPINKTISVEELKDFANGNAAFVVEDDPLRVNKMVNFKDYSQDGFIFPGDPCTSKQAIERDLPTIKYEKDEPNFEELTTVTPVNTPIELNYPNDNWDRMTNLNSVEVNKNSEGEDHEHLEGWFLHPQISNDFNENETFDVDDGENLDSTFEALRRQLAEVLPQPQGIKCAPEYLDEDEKQSNSSFDEYRSPLDGILGLLIDNECSTLEPAQNEVIINYKRSLSPILEESEEETYKTFVLNETKCLDSTSTGCLDTGEAIMGVTKTLMASNDTLFNFEDTLGEKEDVFSPRIPSRSDSQTNTPAKHDRSIEDDSLRMTVSDASKETESVENVVVGRRSPPKTISILDIGDLKQNDLCSPDQQKTLSEGTSSTTDRFSSDMSPTVDHDTTYTSNTVDDKTCVTVIIKDDERISEISEPDWGSTASYGAYELNSLTDVPSLGTTIFQEGEDIITKYSDQQNLQISAENVSENLERDNGQDDSGHSTQVSTEEKFLTNDISAQLFVEKQILMNQSGPSTLYVDNFKIKENCEQFLRKEIEFCSLYSSQSAKSKRDISQKQITNDAGIDCSKENADPNIINVIFNSSLENDKISYQKVQMYNQDTVIVDKSKNISMELQKELCSEAHHNVFHQPVIAILTSKHQETISNYSVNDVSGIQKEPNCIIVADEILEHLSGEEDPWVESVNVLSTFVGPNEWDSDIDDSHSSEEFMYVHGTSKKEEFSNVTKNKNSDSDGLLLTDGFEEIRNSADDEVSEESSSEFEREFVPSCWDSLATPARSSLKSPEKSRNECKKRRTVAFKKQQHYSVYEYPREQTTLSPAYSEPFIWNNTTEDPCFKVKNQIENIYDGFSVSSSMQPFHGNQFNTLCHTWPVDSDFSWSQEDLEHDINIKDVAKYNYTRIKSIQTLGAQSKDEDNEHNTKNNDKVPDSDGETTSNTLSGQICLGELCLTKSNLHLPCELLSAMESSHSPPPQFLSTELGNKDSRQCDLFSETSVLLTPSCTGSMDSLSSSSSSERQLSFTTFGKRKFFSENDKRDNSVKDHIRPAIILIDSNSTTSNFKSNKVKQGDSTDEDSGIESIMKTNKEHD